MFRKKPKSRPETPSARDATLAALRSWIEAQRRPAWRPLVDLQEPEAGRSKFCGSPHVMPGEDVPVCKLCGRELQLLVQLDLDQVPGDLHGSGVLQLFYCVGRDPGGADDGHVECWAEGAWQPFSDDASLVRVVPHADLHVHAARGRHGFPAASIVGWEGFLDLPDPEDHQDAGLHVAYDLTQRLVTLQCPQAEVDATLGIALLDRTGAAGRRSSSSAWRRSGGRREVVMVRSTRRFAGVAVVVAAGLALAVAEPGAPTRAAAVTGASFVPTAVERVFDTRSGSGGVTPASSPLSAGTFYDVVIPGCPEQTTAVALNVTATESDGGFVAVYAGGTRTVSTSLLNPNPGGTRANFTLVPVGPGNTITVYSQRRTHLLADRFGCMVAAPDTGVAAGRFLPVDPNASTRVVDTREQNRQPSGRRMANSVTRIAVAGPGFSAVALTVTVDRPAGAGWLGVAPGGTFSFAAPTSNVNFLPDEARAGFVMVPLADDGTIDVAVSQDVDVVIDVAGYFTSTFSSSTLDGVFVSQTARLFDSRGGGGAGRVKADESAQVPLPSFVGTAAALFLNYTADDAVGGGFLSGWSGPAWRLSSSVNYSPGETSPNSGITALVAPESDLKVRVGVADTAVIVDQTGYFTDLPVSVGGTTTAAIETALAERINQLRANAGRTPLSVVRLTSSRACAQSLARATIAQRSASESSPHAVFDCAESGTVIPPPDLSSIVTDAIGYGTTPDELLATMQSWRNDPAALLRASSTQLEVGCAVSAFEAGVVWCTAFLYEPV